MGSVEGIIEPCICIVLNHSKLLLLNAFHQVQLRSQWVKAVLNAELTILNIEIFICVLEIDIGLVKGIALKRILSCEVVIDLATLRIREGSSEDHMCDVTKAIRDIDLTLLQD